MIDSSTLYLILAMALFVIVAILMVHHHNSSEQIHRKRGEVETLTAQYNKKIEILEQEVIDIKLEIDDIDDEIDAIQH